MLKKLFSCLKKYGIKETFRIIYEVVLYTYLCKFVGFFLKRKPIKNIILLESHNDFDCNAGALYDYLLKVGANEKYKIVWMLKNKFYGKLPPNVTYVYMNRPSIRRAYYNWMAKFILCDCNMAKKMRKSQLSIYLTHGAIALKNVIGLEVIDPTVDYALAGSPNYDEVFRRQVSMREHQKMLYFGFPCLDILYKETEEVVSKLTKEKYNKTVVWMPTFRKGEKFKRNDSTIDFPLGIPLIFSKSEYNELNEYLKKYDMLLIIKLHPMQDVSANKELINMSNILILNGMDMKKADIDLYQLIKDADALISDFSSISYQFLLLDRPLGFELSDMNTYKLGFSVNNPEDFIVGKKIYKFQDLKDFLEDVCIGKDIYKDKRKKLMDYLYIHQDGCSCERIYNFLNDYDK